MSFVTESYSDNEGGGDGVLIVKSIFHIELNLYQNSVCSIKLYALFGQTGGGGGVREKEVE